MTLDLNICNAIKKLSANRGEYDPGDVYLIDSLVHEHLDYSMTRKVNENREGIVVPWKEHLPNPPIT